MFEQLPEILAIGGGFAGSVSLVAFSTVAYVRVKQSQMRAVKTPVISASAKTFNDSFNVSVNDLKEIIEEHYQYGYKKTASKMKTILVNADDLFGRIQKKGNNEQLIMASVKYANLFNKVAYAMNKDHYIDIAQNPNLWENPEKRIKDSEAALDSVQKQIIDNIKQVNSSKDLDFKIVLEALTSESQNQNVMEEIFIKKQVKDVVR